MPNVMQKSNIYAYTELTKLVNELKASSAKGKLKEKLMSQYAYFNIIEPRYFSETLLGEWESILGLIKHKGAKLDEEGKVVANEVRNTIDHLTDRECQVLVDKVYAIYDKVKAEYV
ncbi:hypothetical protein FEM33_01110 [Dyadobacter flavalbus]|uniref:Uncharacterized protein n=2 Tax=Dyadobacter flavalbus TaxID=2579942 RepID=A0A5M8R259_9BACT|nr:hypothetical protein FEM33_01110 [Dyadobacter flavalbus]